MDAHVALANQDHAQGRALPHKETSASASQRDLDRVVPDLRSWRMRQAKVTVGAVVSGSCSFRKATVQCNKVKCTKAPTATFRKQAVVSETPGGSVSATPLQLCHTRESLRATVE